jgi:hypothetical protein
MESVNLIMFLDVCIILNIEIRDFICVVEHGSELWP